MAVPKKRRSKSKSRTMRASWKVEVPQLRACSNCNAMTVPHRACPECGFYKGRQVIFFKVKEKKTEE